ncbi:MAG: leucyl aminopeptidase [Pseudomonadota bacterium]
MKIKFARPQLPKKGTLVLLVEKGAKLGALGEKADEASGGQLSRAMKSAGFEGRKDTFVDVPGLSGVGADRVFLAGVGAAEDLSEKAMEFLGGALAGKLQSHKGSEAAIAVECASKLDVSESDAAARVASGLKLRTYRFDTYKSKKKPAKADDQGPQNITVLTSDHLKARKAFEPLSALADGVHLARDLVNEPPNVLHPEEFARRIKGLSKSGLKVEVLSENQMKKLGMETLLAVGYGSERESKLAIMRWSGGPRSQKPVAFVGKGVTFDTGGISLKPGAGMGDMKGDMGGAACVTGLMLALAGRKAKVNAVGIVGLVENMPDGRAQRPGDIVTSMSGQTVEVLNTDAEGRLVLADALWYTQQRFKPQFMVDLATLTGAILIALGKEHAGMFSNSDELCDRLTAVGHATGETVWRMPLGPAYDKMINSDFADMKNIGGREAGATTAAQFLQRFVNDVPWAHLDVAGTAMGSKKTAINQSWGGGWGVRLLDKLVAEHYEGK